MMRVFPAWCYQCHAFIRHDRCSPSRFLCSVCYGNLPRFETELCLKCGRKHSTEGCGTEWAKAIQALYAVFPYQDPIRQWIGSFKYNRNLLTGRILQQFIKDWFAANCGELAHVQVLLPIPLHWGRLNQRGFNQAAYLLNKQTHFKIDMTLLQKKTGSMQQAGTSKLERKSNLKGVFRVNDKIKNKNILLFDDVCTTGQTLAEAAKTLRNSGASRVDALVLCRSLNLI
jgi:ComF family protein